MGRDHAVPSLAVRWVALPRAVAVVRDAQRWHAVDVRQRMGSRISANWGTMRLDALRRSQGRARDFTAFTAPPIGGGSHGADDWVGLVRQLTEIGPLPEVKFRPVAAVKHHRAGVTESRQKRPT